MCDIHKYPKEIVPNSTNKVRMNIDNMIKSMELYLVRRTINKPIEYLFNGHKCLNEDSLSVNIFNYSLNLLGGEFNETHLPWRQKENAQKTWNGEDVDIKCFEGCVEILDNCYPIYFKAHDIHGISIPYKRNFDTLNEFAKHEERARQLGNAASEVWSQDNKEIELKGTILLAHDPTMLNYWHVVCDSFPADQKAPMDSTKGVWKKNLRNAVLLIFKSHYSLTKPPIKDIPKEYYH